MKGKIIYVNDIFEDITGYTTKELYRRNFIPFVHPDDFERTAELWNGLYEGKFFEDVEYRIINKNGDVRWSSSSWRVIKNKNGIKLGILGKQQDISRRIQREDDFTKERVEAGNTTRGKLNFLANMSHEIRTPITAIIGFIELLKLFPQMPSKKRNKYLQNIHRSSEHLLKLLEEVLDFSRIDSGAIVFESITVNTKDFFFQAFNSFKLQVADKGLSYNLIYKTKIPEYIKIDPTRVRQVLFNLISNAVKFTEKGSVSVEISYSRSLELIMVEVKDSGIGIDESHRGNLFNPYEQLDVSISREYGGTGLGLCLSKKIVEKLGGTIDLVSSELGKGSVFQFSFPYIECVSGEECKSPDINKSDEAKTLLEIKDKLNGLRLLLVEDSDDTRLTLKHLFSVAGADFKIVHDGFSAVNEVKNANYDIILMDLQLPTLGGSVAAKKIRNQGYKGKIIAFSAFDSKDLELQVQKNEFDDLIEKPFNIKKLIKILRKYIK